MLLLPVVYKIWRPFQAMSFRSDDVDDSDSLEVVSTEKSGRMGMGGRMLSGKKRRQLLAAYAQEKHHSISSPVRNTGEDAAVP